MYFKLKIFDMKFALHKELSTLIYVGQTYCYYYYYYYYYYG